MITVVDYGLGNLRSVEKAIQRLNFKAKITNNPDVLRKAKKIILPGVGHFSHGIGNIKGRGFFEILNELVLDKKIPILGICLGMQLMTEFSEEGNSKGFGWINAQTKKFSFNSDNKLKIPHMGWNNVFIKKASPLGKDINENDFFYFVHSYYVECQDEQDILFKTIYGVEFVSGFQKDNVFGVQFHPEKSHEAGLQIIKNFAEL